MLRLASRVASAVVFVGLFAYAALVARHAWGSAFFLGASGGVLVLCVQLLGRAAVALFVEPPIVELAVATGRRRKELEREKTMLMKALKELEFDHEMHKVSDADFAEIGGVYRARAIRVMRQLDEQKIDYGALIEEELWRKRGAVKKKAVPMVPGCPQCGALNDADAIFCKKCAHRLVAAAGNA